MCLNYSSLYPFSEDLEAVNSKVLNEIMNLPDGLRKEIRLLAKQYELLEIIKEPDDRSSSDYISRGNYILKYRNFGQTETELFEWIISERQMRN